MTDQLTLDDFLPYRLSVTANAVSTRISSAYQSRFELKVTEWRLLAILAEQSRLTPAMLGEATRMDKISVSRAAAALIARALVTTDANAGDGRSHFLSLTAAGRSLYDTVVPLAVATERRLTGSFTPDEVACLHLLLRRLEAAALTDGPAEAVPVVRRA